MKISYDRHGLRGGSAACVLCAFLLPQSLAAQEQPTGIDVSTIAVSQLQHVVCRFLDPRTNQARVAKRFDATTCDAGGSDQVDMQDCSTNAFEKVSRALLKPSEGGCSGIDPSSNTELWAAVPATIEAVGADIVTLKVPTTNAVPATVSVSTTILNNVGLTAGSDVVILSSKRTAAASDLLKGIEAASTCKTGAFGAVCGKGLEISPAANLKPFLREFKRVQR